MCTHNESHWVHISEFPIEINPIFLHLNNFELIWAIDIGYLTIRSRFQALYFFYGYLLHKNNIFQNKPV
jgi:hypothetical protein